MKKSFLSGITLLIIVLFFLQCDSNSNQSFSKETKPWTYWFWLGSSVTKQGITKNLEALQSAGIGGVSISCIYGEKGDEANFIKFLSPDWMEMLKHTAFEAERLGMGVDMWMSEGWPFGGPDVTLDDAAKACFFKPIIIKDGTNIYDYLGENATLVSLSAYDEKGKYFDITSYVNNEGFIKWKPTNSQWKIFVMFQQPTGQKVKRTIPEGEGFVLDYFSKKSILNYFRKFPDAFKQAGIPKGKLRAFQNDSFEVSGANWTNDFLEQFKKRRGYDLRPYICYLADTTDCETRQRIVTDYCETVSDLLHDGFIATWIDKSHELGMQTRNQAHGSPGNLLDLYALADIPETEAFGASGFSIPGLRLDPDYPNEKYGRPNPLMMKFASSAAHVRGRKLVSSETATWLADHFKVSLSQVKPEVDELFVSGINHIFYHVCTYTPFDKAFPGRLYYATTDFGPNSHFWKELPALSHYIAQCQSVLQNTKPDNDILLYFPIHDMWKKQKTELIIRGFQVHNTKYWLKNSPFYYLGQRLWDSGYTFDYVSDKMLNEINVDGSTLVSGVAHYKAILVPACEIIPLETLTRLLELAKNGALIIFENAIPYDVPGLFEVEKRKASLAEIKNIMLSLKGNVSVTSQLFETLSEKGIDPEEMKSKGLEFIRKKSDNNIVYFVTNLSNTFSEDWIKLGSNKKNIEIYDPVRGERGKAAKRDQEGASEIYLQLEPGQSCILTCSDKYLSNRKWKYLTPVESKKFEIKGDWKLTPEEGAPEIPSPVSVKEFGSWTAYGGDYETVQR